MGAFVAFNQTRRGHPLMEKRRQIFGDREGDEGPLVSRVAMAGRGREVAVSDPSGERGSMATT